MPDPEQNTLHASSRLILTKALMVVTVTYYTDKETEAQGDYETCP